MVESPSALRPLVTEVDNARLRGLMSTPIARRHGTAMRTLLEKLNHARIVPAARVPSTIVTMNSRVACWDDQSGAGYELSLVYPWNADPASGRVSILSQLGITLLGAMPGQAVRLDGRTLKIAYLSYQPEAEQQFHL